MGFFYFIAASLIVILGLKNGGVLLSLVDPASVLIVLGGTLTLLFASWSLKDIAEAVDFVLSRQTSIPRRKYNKLSAIYAAAGDYALYCGLLGTFIGIVLILQMLMDPANLGPCLSVSAVTLFYGLTCKLLALLAKHKLELCTLTEDDYPIRHRSQPGPFIAGTTLFLIVILLGIQGAGSVLSFIDPPTVIILFGGSLFVSLLFIPVGECMATIKASFSDEVSSAQAGKAMGVFHLYHDIVVALVLFAATAGLIGTLQSLNEPSKLGPYLALSLIPFCYGLVLLVFTRAKSCCMERKMVELNLQTDARPVFGAGYVTLIGLGFYLLAASTLIYTVSR